MTETFMTALQIQSVRHLKNITIPLSSTDRKSLILTGKNGSGKTSVLTALKSMLTYLVSNNFYPEEFVKDRLENLGQQYVPYAEDEQTKLNNAQLKGRKDLWKNHMIFWTTGAIPQYTSYADLRDKYNSGKYILAFYTDDREISVDTSDTIEKVNLPPFYDIAAHPSKQLVKYLVNLKTTQAFAQAKNDTERANEIADWFSRFEDILRELFEDESLNLVFNIDTFKFTIQLKNREPFDFNSMSMGYAAVFDIIGDLIMRMEAQKNYNLEGLVLIDEIETHLHVELQKKIMPILMKLFPNIQFVLTSHSPFILNSTPDTVVYDLENQTLAENGLTNLPYEGIVEGYFGADLLSDELKEKFEEYRSIVHKQDLTDADWAKVAELELYLDEVPDYLAIDFAAEYNRLQLELSERG